MSQNTKRQLMILGIGALFVVMLSIYRKRLPNGYPVARPEEMQTEQQTETEQEIQTEGIQITVPGGDPQVRVLICSDNYESEYHDRLTLQCSTDYTVSYGDITEEHKASEPVWFTLDDPWLSYGAVTLTAKDKNGTFTLPDLQRAQEAPAYEGKFIIEKKAEGLLVVNELPLETYLRYVVPSEMPADYPMEALKAQAICARTYAMKQIQGNRGEKNGVDLDDSVSYQVYNNIKNNERTDQAVSETKGKVLMRDGDLIDALYYSTSCGIQLSDNPSDEAVFCSLLSTRDEKAYEKEEPWYRWSVSFSLEELTELVKTGWQEDFGVVTGMEVVSREPSGVIAALKISGEGGEFQVEGEYTIRKLLQTRNSPVTLQDGSTAPNLGMLPSAFFYLTPNYEKEVLTGYTLTGGGYGHGKGMSQNGAKHMADAGHKCADILRYYYAE